MGSLAKIDSIKTPNRSKFLTLAVSFLQMLLLLLGLILITQPVLGSNNNDLGLAQYQIIDSEQEVIDGQVISLRSGKYTLSSTEYEDEIIGVVETNPALSLNLTPTSSSAYPILSSGNAYVLANLSNGEIRVGDWVTSSSTKGEIMRATEPGMVIGQALEDYLKNENLTSAKSILVALNIHQSGEIIVDESLSEFEQIVRFIASIFKFFSPSSYDEPSKPFRYFLSTIVLLLSLTIGYLSLSRLARSGIEALGRNPLAAKLITLGMVVNVVLTLVAMLGGFVTAYYILTI